MGGVAGCICLTVSVNDGLFGMRYVVGMSAMIFGSFIPSKRLRASYMLAKQPSTTSKL